jgi:chitinase
VISDDAATATLRSSGVVAPPPSVYVSDSGMIRPAVGTASANFTVSLGSASSAPVTVTYATTDGSATAAGGDYTATVGTVTFAPGETAKTVAVTVAATGRHSVMDSFGLVLSSPTGAIIGDGSATGRLTSRNGLVTIRATDAAVVRSTSVPGSVTIAVSLSSAPAPGESVTVSVATANGSAIAGVDYTALGATTVTFAAGETTKFVTVPISVGAPGAPRRTFSLMLSSPSANALVSDASALVTVLGP